MFETLFFSVTLEIPANPDSCVLWHPSRTLWRWMWCVSITCVAVQFCSNQCFLCTRPCMCVCGCGCGCG